MENKEFCELEFVDEDVYSRPILLQHFPLYRESDINCGNEDGKYVLIFLWTYHISTIMDMKLISYITLTNL